jgi:uncharacterized membrane protein YphA (DoxX/SURF4 family)
MSSPAAQNLGLFLARVPLGMYFAIDGLSRIHGPGGVTGFVSANVATTSRVLPEAMARGYLTALPFAELLIGLMLAVGLYQRLGAFVAAIALGLVALTTGPNKWVYGPPFNQYLIFLGLAITLLTVGPGKLSADAMLFGNKKKKKPEPAAA